MLIADRCANAKCHNDAEHMRRNIGTARVVAEVFRELFLAAIWSRKPRLNRYPRRGNPLNELNYYVLDRGVLCK